MKKAIIVFVVLSILTGCKKPEEAAAKTLASKPSDKCTDLSEYVILTDVDEKAEWLRKNGENVCRETLFAEILKTHDVGSSTMVFTLGKKEITISWKDFKYFIGTTFYNAYLSFTFDKNGDLDSLILVPKFDKTLTCYSIPLFLALDNDNPFKETDLITFKKGYIGGTEKIIFTVRNDFFDISNEPLSWRSKEILPIFREKK